MAKNDTRLNRINEELKKEISHVLTFELKNPNVTGLLSVTRAKITPDLKYARAYISVLGSPEEGKDTIKGLKSAEGYIRHQLAQRVNLRNTPELTFVLDQSIEYGINMSKKIDEVTKDLHRDDEAEEE